MDHIITVLFGGDLEWARIAVVPMVPVVVAILKRSVPKLPASVLPWAAVVTGVLADVCWALGTGGHLSPALWAVLGPMGIGLREIYDQTRRAATHSPGPRRRRRLTMVVLLAAATYAVPLAAAEDAPPRSAPAGWCSAEDCDVGAATSVARWRCRSSWWSGRWCSVDALAGDSTVGAGGSVSIDRAGLVRGGVGLTAPWEDAAAGYAMSLYVVVGIGGGS